MTLTALVETTETDLMFKPCGSLHYCEEIGADMMVVHRSYPKDADHADVMANRIPAESVTLTTDGKDFIPQWELYEGHAADDDLVYVERHSDRGREFHGWIDPVTRKIIQAG